MKKLLALLLAAVMCLSLAACGGDAPNTNDNSTQQGTNDNSENNASQGNESNTTDNTDYAGELTQLLCEKNVWYGMCHGEGDEEELVFFEDGHYEWNGSSYTWEFVEYYENASDYFDAESTPTFQTPPNYAADSILYCTDKFFLGYDIDGNLLLYTNYDYWCYNQSQYELVEITLDNWQDYFEIRTHNAFAESGFGEFERVVTWYLLVSKEGIVFDENNCNVTFEYTYTIEHKPYTIDFENKTITYGETIATETSEPIVKTMSGVGNYFDEEPFSKYGETVGSANILDELQGDTNVVVSVEITRISGSFCVAK